MSQEQSTSKPRRTRYLWLWMLMLIVVGGPAVVVVVLAVSYVATMQVEQARANAEREAYQRVLQQNAELQARLVHSTGPTPPVNPSQTVERFQPHVVGVAIRFEGLKDHYTDAIVVDQTVLIAPLDPYLPVTGKLNGRMITRQPTCNMSNQPIPAGPVSMFPGAMPPSSGSMGYTPMGYAPDLRADVIGRIPSAGLVTLSTQLHLAPLQVLGDFNKVAIGDKVTTVTTNVAIGSQELTVLGIDETVVSPSGQSLQHLLKLTEWKGNLGSLICNRNGPIGQILFTAGNEGNRLTYAIPMDLLFKAYYENMELSSAPRDSVETTMDPGSPLEPAASESRALTPKSDLPAYYVEDTQPPTIDPSSTPTIGESESPEDPGIVSPPSPNHLRVFRAAGNPADVARALRELFGNECRISFHEDSRSIIVKSSSQEVLDRVGIMLHVLNDSTQQAEKEEAAAVQTGQTSNKGGFEASDGTATSMPGGLAAVSAAAQQDDREAALERETRQAAKLVRSASPAQAAALKKSLEQLVERHFDLRQALRNQEINSLSQRLDKLRMSQQRRQQNRFEVVQRRVSELLDPSNDLRWDSSGKAGEQPQSTLATVPDLPSNSEPQPVTLEKTFDGVPYSHWKKMLATERKAEKLVAAMEASSRLAEPNDAAEITHSILVAARRFDSSRNEDAGSVTRACWSAFNRLPADVVVRELKSELGHAQDPEFRPGLVARFISEECNLGVMDLLVTGDREMVAMLINPEVQAHPDGSMALAAACRIVSKANRKIDEYEGLKPLVLNLIDNGTLKDSRSLSWPWYVAAEAMVVRNADTPDLALKMARHLPVNLNVLELLGKMGPHAEPAVPTIVSMFVEYWNEIEGDLERGPALLTFGTPPHIRMLKTLSDIGAGERAAVLFRELALIAPGTRRGGSRGFSSGRAAELFTIASTALPAIKTNAPLDAPMALPDRSVICGDWQLKSATPSSDNCTLMSISLSRLGITCSKGPGVQPSTVEWGNRFEIDPKTTPKSIAALGSVGGRRNGIYELTDTTLKFQLAPPDQPAPKEFAADDGVIPEGHIRMTFTRSLPKPPVQLELDKTSPVVR